MLTECRADLGYQHIDGLYAPRRRKLLRHRQIGRAHRGGADVMNDVIRALRNVSALDQVAELALVQSEPDTVAKRRHAEIAEMRADAQPVQFLGRLYLPQANVIAIEAFQFSEFRRRCGVLFGAYRP